MNKKLIRSLYKSKIQICRDFGYKYGSLVNKHDNDNFKYILSDNKKRRYLRRMSNEKYVNFVTNHIKYEYKINKELKDKEDINKEIDYGFYILRNMNEIFNDRF